MTCHVCGCRIDDYYIECECGCRAFRWSWRVLIAAVLWRGGSMVQTGVLWAYDTALRFAAREWQR